MTSRRLDMICTAVLADSCAIQNILSSTTLHAACQRHGVHFAMTKYCLYECLDKPRKQMQPGDVEIQRRLREARSRGLFPDHGLAIEDLQEVGMIQLRRRVGAGELSAIALAKRFGIGLQTDDDRAEKLAVEVLTLEKVQTTPHLLGWLACQGHLADHEAQAVVSEHVAAGRKIGPRLQAAHTEACRVRLLIRTNAGEGSP